MRSEPIPKSMREEIAESDLANKCLRRLALHDHECEGRITWEHAILYRGKRVNELWAIVPLCAKAHEIGAWQDSGNMVKDIGEWIAINRMTPSDERKYPKFNWSQRRRYLNSKYGKLNLSEV